MRGFVSSAARRWIVLALHFRTGQSALIKHYSPVWYIQNKNTNRVRHFCILYVYIYSPPCPSLAVCLSVCLSICLSVYLSVCLSIYLSVCLSVCLSVWPLVRLPVCLDLFVQRQNLFAYYFIYILFIIRLFGFSEHFTPWKFILSWQINRLEQTVRSQEKDMTETRNQASEWITVILLGSSI